VATPDGRGFELGHYIAHYVSVLAVLVRKGLARARRETIMAGGKAIEVYRVRIMTAGRRAIES